MHSSRFLLVLIVALGFVLTPFTGPGPYHLVSKGDATSSDFVAGSILFDESHTNEGSSLWAPGNASLLSSMLGENGYESTTNLEDSLDSDILGDYDILVIFFPEEELTTGEITAIESFVDAGGGLLIVGCDAVNGWGFDGTNLNPLSETFGIAFNQDELTGTIENFEEHHISTGVTSMMLSADDLGACSLSLESPAEAVASSGDSPVLAASTYGSGRIVAVGTPSPFYMYRRGAYDFGGSHFQISLNIMDWLIGNGQRDALVPEIAEIIVGNGPDLAPSEIEDYHMYVGLYHDHTTHSDGRDTVPEMVEAGIDASLDFMVLTDHSHDTPVSVGGITGAEAARDLSQRYSLDIVQIIGAELSSVKHTVGFPLTENIFTASQQIAVDEIHAQDAIAILCHPTIGPDYAPVYEAYDSYGYDAVEVDNSGYFFGGGEDGLYRRFLGASDGHAASFVGKVLNAVFVKDPSGPNGQITDADLVEAVMDKRVVILDKVNDFVYGQQVWVNRFLDLQDEANQTISDAGDTIQALLTAGHNISVSLEYLGAAENALANWNPARAIDLANNATSEVALNLDFSASLTPVIDPESDFEITMELANDNDFGVKINTTVYAQSGMLLEEENQGLAAGADSVQHAQRTSTAKASGIIAFWLNIASFNTSEYLRPILLKMSSAIDNVTVFLEDLDSGYAGYIRWMQRTESRRFVSSASIIYDDGSGPVEAQMEEAWSWYQFYVGPYSEITNVTCTVNVTDIYGNVYTMSQRTFTIGPPETTEPPALDPLSIVVPVAVVGVIAVAAVGLYLMRRRRTV
ncbi:hypothetical protein EU546_03910 [Candidatus Thorarchaeota archaeon]|nr:MAG: hypothetical protein EU546_03910 [Candidatus Thorarchaeota archaeon]